MLINHAILQCVLPENEHEVLTALASAAEMQPT